MDEKNYKIKLADGTVVEDLKINGNNFISNKVIDQNIFDGNCSPVIISDGTREDTHDNMELVQITNTNDEYWFVLRDISVAELKQLKIQSDIEYIAMMSGVEL